MSKKEMVALIETMNNYDELAAKAKAKADAIREAIKEEMNGTAGHRGTDRRSVHCPLHQRDFQSLRQHHLQAAVRRSL